MNYIVDPNFHCPHITIVGGCEHIAIHDYYSIAEAHTICCSM